MKFSTKLMFVLGLLSVAMLSVSTQKDLFAQEDAPAQEVVPAPAQQVAPAQLEEARFSISYRVVSVLQSTYGYRVVYRSSNFEEREYILPTRWIFRDKVALLSFSYLNSAPYLQVFYDDADMVQFVRLVLPRDPNHHTLVYDFEEGLQEKFEQASLGSGL